MMLELSAAVLNCIMSLNAVDRGIVNIYTCLEYIQLCILGEIDNHAFIFFSPFSLCSIQTALSPADNADKTLDYIVVSDVKTLQRETSVFWLWEREASVPSIQAQVQ